ncbi:MAG: 3-deoxy-manno-octulosonate cytidylyltransferase [Amphiplicatus sp.]
MKTAIIIPARYASTRLPGKMLLEAAGKPLIQHVYEAARRARRADIVLIATDDARIENAARGFGAEVVMTDPGHTAGSARVAEAALGLDADIIVNLQGDEPEIDPAHIDRLIGVQAAHAPFASTLVCPFPADASPDDPARVKAVLGRPAGEGVHEALYFTRARAPFPRDGAGAFHLHVGLYAFRAASLQTFARAPEARLERIERLEQLRILEMGERILAAIVPTAAPGVDTPEDFAAFKTRAQTRR